LQSVTMDDGDNSAKVWETVCSPLAGTITGKFLSDGTASISKIDLPAGAKGKLTDYLDNTTLTTVSKGSSDTKLKFTMQLKNPIPTGSKLYFVVTKSSSSGGKGPTVKSMEYTYEVTYTLPDPAKKPSTTLSTKSCKEKSTTVATPTFEPEPSDFKAWGKVEIKDATKDNTIYFTDDGKTPTDKSTKYDDPIEVSKETTIKAIATAKGLSDSEVATGEFKVTKEKPAPTPQIAPKAGAVKKGTKVTITDSDKKAVIRYTTNGDTPTSKSTKYDEKNKFSITISAKTTIKAIAIVEGSPDSEVAEATYTLSPSTRPKPRK
jgi:hypothetical protein